MQRLRIGTSGWHYRHWWSVYYPEKLASSRWLGFYAGDFDCVEVNNSFYRFPSAATVADWCNRVSPDFRFALKASQFITHRKKLRDCREPLERFFTEAAGFGERLGPILFQLPPRWRVNVDRLRQFVALLPEDLDYSMEFRDPSWHTPQVYELLAESGIAFCQFHLAGFLSPLMVTTDLVYIRLHGPGAAYCGSYSDRDLGDWATRIRDWMGEGRQVWLFFDNDEAGAAVRDARRIMAMLDCRTGSPND
jgi:uncharacterized protein YecE (DUF72 family)